MSFMPILFIEPLPPRFGRSTDEAVLGENRRAGSPWMPVRPTALRLEGEPDPDRQITPESSSNVARICSRSRTIEPIKPDVVRRFSKQKEISMTEETVRETVKRVWEELERYYDELNGASDRAAAILASAYFEGKLGDAIMRRFTQANSAFFEQMELGNKVFKDYNPIRDFAAKIEIGFALGLYNNEIRKNLQKSDKHVTSLHTHPNRSNLTMPK